LDRQAPVGRKHVKRRAMLAVLAFAGVRIGELLDLRWRDVDLAAGWLTVQGTKTDQATRKIKLRGALRDELIAIRADGGSIDPDARVFPTSEGKRFGAENFRNRILAGAVREANAKLSAAGRPPLPEGLTPHSLRRTFASVLYALGEDPGTVMDELGHADPGLALRMYRQAMRRGEAERGRLRALVEGVEFRAIKGDEADGRRQGDLGSRHRNRRKPLISRHFRHRAAIAQLVERELPKLEVAGSRPVRRFAQRPQMRPPAGRRSARLTRQSRRRDATVDRCSAARGGRVA
jgi:hypothetical protein